MDCTWITAYRTGAATALSARYLARPTSETVGVLACGVQGRTNLEALATLFPVRRVSPTTSIPRRSAGSSRRWARSSASRSRASRRRGRPSPTATRRHLRSDPQEADAHNREGLAEARRVRERRGLRQLLVARRAGRVRPDRYRRPRAVPVLPACRLLPAHAGSLRRPRRDWWPGSSRDARTTGERTMAINLGLALDDMAVAPEVFRRAKARGLGTWLAL